MVISLGRKKQQLNAVEIRATDLLAHRRRKNERTNEPMNEWSLITFDVLNTLQECARWVWLAGRAEDNLINGLTNTSNKAWPASKNWIYVCWQKLAICWSISTELNCCCGGGPSFQKSGQVCIWLDLQNSARTKEPVLMFFFFVVQKLSPKKPM